MYTKVGSIYSFNKINGKTNIFTLNNRANVNYVIFRIIGIPEDSTISVNVDGNVFEYLIRDISILFNKDNSLLRVPYSIYYYVDSDYINNQFIFGINIGYINSSLSIVIEPTEYISSGDKYSKYSAEALYVMCSSKNVSKGLVSECVDDYIINDSGYNKKVVNTNYNIYNRRKVI